jgi:hypothetical protein
MESDIQNQIDRMNALLFLSAADISALVATLQGLADSCRAAGVQVPDVSEDWLERRKQIAQTTLESLEFSNPAYAARIQELIDDNCTNYPFGYDS